MERNKARELLPSIIDPVLRQAETSRIEGNYHLGIAMDHLFAYQRGRCPTTQESLRVFDAVQQLIYDSGSTVEEKARVEHANGVLDSEFRKSFLIPKAIE